MKVPGNIVTSCAAIAGNLSGLCPDPDAIENGQRFHGEMTCDRAAQHECKAKLNRNMKYRALKEEGTGVSAVPNQKTAYCPLNPDNFQPQQSEQLQQPLSTGLDTVWIVENTASTPVVVSFINEEGLEVSAKHNSIAPAENDPDTILQPNQWMAVDTFEGHVFYARELLEDGHAGEVLLQHRVGLIPVGAHLADQITDCPETDPEPLKDNERAPEFRRTTSVPIRPCHTIDVGFRNVLGCPLHGYYVSLESTNAGTEEGDISDVTCTEAFKFHLGTNAATPDFMWDWASPTKYEGTFVGHTFSFRLAHDPTVLVERITLEPTRVTDCPSRKQKVAVGVSADGLVIPVERHEQLHEDNEQQQQQEEEQDIEQQENENDQQEQQLDANDAAPTLPNPMIFMGGGSA